MNKAQNRPTLHKVLSMILALVMVLSLLPMSGFTSTTALETSDGNSFVRIVHVDCGRKYFSQTDLKKIIDYAAASGYTHVELAFGNDGLRFLLNDMSVTANDETYTSDAVKAAIKKGNAAYDSSASYSPSVDELTEDEMDAIIAYAKNKDIGIIPMFDAPGHLYAVVKAMETLGLTVTSYTASNSGDSPNVSIKSTDSTSLEFVKALMQKYIDYFQTKGSTYFNIAADECGFYNANHQMTADEYTAYTNFVNSMAAAVKTAGMTPMAFNDGINHKKFSRTVEFDKNIKICYWTAGENYATAAELAADGFGIINTNTHWYYVIGKETSSNRDNWNSYAYYNDYAIDNMSASGSCYKVDGDNSSTVMPVGCMAAIWCDNPSATVDWTNVENYVKALQTGNPTVFVTSSTDVDTDTDTDTDTDVAVTDDKTITVTIGEEKTDTIDGTNYSGKNYTTEDTSIATISVTGDDATEGTATYSKVNSGVRYSSIATNTTWTKTSYYYNESGDNYYPVYAKYQSGRGNSKTYYYGYSTTDSASDVQQLDSSSSSNSKISNLYTMSGTQAKDPSTTVTFTGVAVGTTYATVGHVRYTINVIRENVTGITLPIQLWITNCAIQMDGTTNKTSGTVGGGGNNRYYKYGYYVKINAGDAYGADGAELSALVPATKSGLKEYGGVYWDASFQNTGELETTTGTETVSDWNTRTARTLDLLKGTLLSSGNYQEIWGSNSIESGTDFNYVRYYNGAWAVSSDRVNWTNVTAGSVTTSGSSGSGTQIVAYYMLRTDVTKEVTTDVIDWGDALPTSNSKVILDYAVKYENGSQVPASFPVSGKTMFFNMLNKTDTYRRIYDIKGLEESGYEIYMITVTPNSDNKNSTISISEGKMPTYSYDGTEKVAWVASEDDLPNAFKDQKYTSISGAITYKVGGEPTISGVEIYKSQAMLVTYYIRAIKTLDSLTVHYVNKQTGKEIHYYNINVVSSVVSPTVFDENIALGDPWKGPLANGTVTNDMGESITVSADLSTMPAISAEYRFSNYECVEVQKSSDLKEVYLYYTFGYDITFVVDFGLPVTIEKTKLSPNLDGAYITRADVTSSSYANVKVNDDFSVTYALKEPISAEDNFSVTYYGTNLTTENDGSVTFNIRIIPASTVYYEDGFASFTSGKYTADSSAKEVAWELLKDNVAQNGTTQALEELGNKTNVYGYDDAYKSSTLYSLGSAHKVTVSAAMAGASDIVWPSATFTFKGTGFDIISLTDSDTGTILYTVTNKDTGAKVCSHILNTYYGYTYEDGEWKVDTDATGIMYQVPVIKVSGLDYANYEVEISVRYGQYFDSTGDGSYSFWLDGIRVYDPMGKNANYDVDDETSPSYVEIREVILDAEALVTEGAKTGAVFIDGKGSDVTAEDYANYGPNHEAYLAKSQAIAFQLVASAKPTSVQLGAKLANGTAGALTITGASCDKATNGVLSLNTSTDMYYELTNLNWTEQDGTYISNVITLTNTSSSTDSIISLTNLKFIGATYTSAIPEVEDAANEAALISLAASPAMVNEAVLAVSSVLAAEPTPDPEPSTEPDPEPSTEPEPDPEPEVKTFEPETFKVSLNKDSIRKGQEATLTVKASAEVTAITVNGTTYEDYQTRFERSGWKWWSADRTEYHVFTVTQKPDETTDYEVIAVNAEGAVSEAETVTLTVKAAQSSWWGDMWNSFFGKWF